MAAEWYYTTNKQQMGPVSFEELRQLATSGLLKSNDMVWAEGMAEWVKAANQSGLFPDAGVTAAGPVARAEADAPAPRRSATRRRIDEELDEHDDSDKSARRKKRPTGGMSTGLKVGLGIGIGVLVLGLIGCGVVGVIAIIFGVRGDGPGGTNYQVNLAPGMQDERTFNFRQGQRVNVTVRTNRVLGNRQPDVDLFIVRRGGLIAADQLIHPDCNITFFAPATDTYTVRVFNLGPNQAVSRVVVNAN